MHCCVEFWIKLWNLIQSINVVKWFVTKTRNNFSVPTSRGWFIWWLILKIWIMIFKNDVTLHLSIWKIVNINDCNFVGKICLNGGISNDLFFRLMKEIRIEINLKVVSLRSQIRRGPIRVTGTRGHLVIHQRSCHRVEHGQQPT